MGLPDILVVPKIFIVQYCIDLNPCSCAIVHTMYNWDNYRSLEIRATLWREGGERRTREEGEGRIAD